MMMKYVQMTDYVPLVFLSPCNVSVYALNDDVGEFPKAHDTHSANLRRF